MRSKSYSERIVHGGLIAGFSEVTKKPRKNGGGRLHATIEAAFAKGLRVGLKGQGADTYRDAESSRAFAEGYARGVKIRLG